MKKCKKNTVLLVLQLEEISLWPELSSTPVNESKVGTLSVTYRAAAGVLIAGQYFSFFFKKVVKKVSALLEATWYFHEKLVVNLFGLYKNFIY